MRTIWIPTDGAKARLYFVPDYEKLEELLGSARVSIKGPGDNREAAPEVETLCLFHRLTVNPLCGNLAGPCPRCDRYYIKKRASQTVYCSRRCGNAATAVARTRERIASERGEKLARAQAATKKWKATATQQDWKAWVASKQGLTRAF